MSAAARLIEEINNRNLPNKDRILDVHKLVEELTESIDEKTERERIQQVLVDYYLSLQFACISEDSVMFNEYRKKLIFMVKNISSNNKNKML